MSGHLIYHVFQTRWVYHGHIFAVNCPMKNSWGGSGLEDWSVLSFFWHIWMLENQHINCLTSNWTSITCGICTHDSCSISQIVTSWTLALIGTQRAWSTKWFVDGPVPLYEMAGCETGYHGLEGGLACHFLAYCSNREKFPFYIISVTPCISKPGLFDMKSADLESKVCHLPFFALCISEVWIP